MEVNEDSWDSWFQGLSSLPPDSIFRQLPGWRLFLAIVAKSREMRKHEKPRVEEKGSASFLLCTLEPCKYSQYSKPMVPFSYSLWSFKILYATFFVYAAECLVWEELQQTAKKFCSFDSQMGCFAVSTANVFKTVCKLGPQRSNSWKHSGSSSLPGFYLKSIEHFSGYRTRPDYTGLDLREWGAVMEDKEFEWILEQFKSLATSKLINNFLLATFAGKSYRWDLKLSIPLRLYTWAWLLFICPH